MGPEELLARVGGAAWRASLIEGGVTDRALAAAKRRGTVASPRRGVYALPDADPVRVASVAWDCHPTCVTAASRLGIPVLRRPAQLHMAVAATRSSSAPHAWPPRTVKVHMSERLRWSSDEAADALDAAGRCVTAVEHLVMVDGALNRGLMTTDDIGRFRFTTQTRSRWLERHCDASTQSPLETVVRIALRLAGLQVETQRAIAGVGRVDFLVNGIVVVETDGRATHALEEAFIEDRRRDRAAALAGYVVLRFGYGDVMDRLPELVAQVQAAVRLWSPAAA